MAWFLPRFDVNDNSMTPQERRATWGLGTVFSLRMLGMFMVLPVLTTYGMALNGASEALIGIAIGIYGLAQGVLQIPFGMASDRWGRKPVLYVGLAIFALGSFLGMFADDIWTGIAARTLQGGGAISSVAMALAADLTREQHRTKVMAMIGSTIGLMFALSVVELLEPEDLTGGAVIAGTGVIRYDGTVDAVGGVKQKVVAATSREGLEQPASVFLVPRQQLAEAARAPVDHEVVGWTGGGHRKVRDRARPAGTRQHGQTIFDARERLRGAFADVPQRLRGALGEVHAGFDLRRGASVVERCLASAVTPYLLEWPPPRGPHPDDGLPAYADRLLVAALVIIILMENLRQTVRTPDELVEVSGADFLGIVPDPGHAARTARGFAVEMEPDSPRAADYRMLATKAELIAGRDGGDRRRGRAHPGVRGHQGPAPSGRGRVRSGRG